MNKGIQIIFYYHFVFGVEKSVNLGKKYFHTLFLISETGRIATIYKK